MANCKSKGKDKSDKDAGQRTPGGVATRDPEASHAEPHLRNAVKNTVVQPVRGTMIVMVNRKRLGSSPMATIAGTIATST